MTLNCEGNEDYDSYKMFTDINCIIPMIPAMLYTFTIDHTTGESRVPYVSSYSEVMFGLPASEITENSEAFMNMVHPGTFGSNILLQTRSYFISLYHR